MGEKQYIYNINKNQTNNMYFISINIGNWSISIKLPSRGTVFSQEETQKLAGVICFAMVMHITFKQRKRYSVYLK